MTANEVDGSDWEWDKVDRDLNWLFNRIEKDIRRIRNTIDSFSAESPKEMLEEFVEDLSAILDDIVAGTEDEDEDDDDVQTEEDDEEDEDQDDDDEDDDNEED